MTLDYTQQHLVKMANQIAGNVPSPDDVAGQIADHVTRFWTPAMRSDQAALAVRSPGCWRQKCMPRWRCWRPRGPATDPGVSGRWRQVTVVVAWP